jgi:hypothetical protein
MKPAVEWLPTPGQARAKLGFRRMKHALVRKVLEPGLAFMSNTSPDKACLLHKQGSDCRNAGCKPQAPSQGCMSAHSFCKLRNTLIESDCMSHLSIASVRCIAAAHYGQFARAFANDQCSTFHCWLPWPRSSSVCGSLYHNL